MQTQGLGPRQPHLLIVDDEPRVRAMLRTYLEVEGFHISEAAHGEQLRQRMQDSAVDLILLDVSLPGEDGLSLARQIREYSSTPIIMVTARNDIIDRVAGLETGADDYICKPFHLREVLARIRSVLRRNQSAAPSQATPADAKSKFRFDDLVLDANRRELRRADGESVPLTSREFTLLHAFVQQPNRVLNRDQIMTLTNGAGRDAFDRSIDQQMVRLRRKIEVDPRSPRLIKTVRGAGYVLACEVEEA